MKYFYKRTRVLVLFRQKLMISDFKIYGDFSIHFTDSRIPGFGFFTLQRKDKSLEIQNLKTFSIIKKIKGRLRCQPL